MAARRPPGASNHERAAAHEPLQLPIIDRSESGSSNSSTETARSPARRVRDMQTSAAVSIPQQTRQPTMASRNELPLRQPVAAPRTTEFVSRHRRQHSQGFFDPSLPSSTSNAITSSMAHLSAPQIAAQAAMHVQNSLHSRRRSVTVPAPISIAQPLRRPSRSTSHLTPHASDTSSASSRANSQTRGAPHAAHQSGPATTAANAAYPKVPLPSAALGSGESASPEKSPSKDQKPGKEKSRMKIFLPKNMHMSANKDGEKRLATVPSPKKSGTYAALPLSRLGNQSMVSLADTTLSAMSSTYASANVSTSTLVPSEKHNINDKEKPRHNFLYRQKNRLKEGSEHYSSASSNSRPIDPSAPQPLYSFAPSSPGPLNAANKSMTGLDLRHGGRALREKKREEKAAAGTLLPPLSRGTPGSDGYHADNGKTQASERITSSTPGLTKTFGPPSATSTYPAEVVQGLTVFGLPGMTPDDAWPLLKARLLNIFEGEDIRTPIEDFNKLVLAHLQRCVLHKTPGLILEDLKELLETGFYSLNQILARVTDDRLVPHLVETWSTVFGIVLPFMQAVFQPLDLELRGRGQLLSPREARDFWAALPLLSTSSPPSTTSFAPNTTTHTTSTSTMLAASRSRAPPVAVLAAVFDVRTLVLVTFRNTIILPRYDRLLSIFSRLSLDSISCVGLNPAAAQPSTRVDMSPSMAPSDYAAAASYNSQASTLLESSAAGSLGARSRATSNTSAMSAGSFTTLPLHPPYANPRESGRDMPGSRGPMADVMSPIPPASRGMANLVKSAKVTYTAARMLQCVSVLAGLQAPPFVTGDNEGDSEAISSRKMDLLAKELKLNWLGRSRTGRNRRGLIGRRPMAMVSV